MKGRSFLLRRLAKIPSRMVQVLHRGMLPQHLRFAIKHNQPGRNPGQCIALKCGHFSVGVFGICFQTIQYCHNPSNREGRVALLNLPPLDTAILVKLAQSQQRVKGYWIWIQSQSTATSVWAQADVQCLFRDAHRIVRSTCLDGAPWSQNNEIVSKHCSILSLEGICPHKFHSGMSPTVNFWTFVASSSWQRFSVNLAGVWNWAQHMALERSNVHLSGMLSPPGQSFEQRQLSTSFLVGYAWCRHMDCDRDNERRKSLSERICSKIAGQRKKPRLRGSSWKPRKKTMSTR